MKDILLSQFKPKSELIVEKHYVPKPKFPVIDFHCHYFNDIRDTGRNYDIEKEAANLYNYGVAGLVNLIYLGEEYVGPVLEYTKNYSDIFVPFGTVDVTGIDKPGFAKHVVDTIKSDYAKGIKGLKFVKDISLANKDMYGNYIRIDDKRLKPIWKTAAELNIPVLIHIADPVAFFSPIDGKNERFEELAGFPEWSFAEEEFFKFDELMDMQENLLSSNPDTTFVLAHFGSYSENLGFVAKQLDDHPNMYIDMAARLNELGRQPYTSRKFLMKYQDRVLFGTDSFPGSSIFPYYYRYLETWDEYFDYNNDIDSGRWEIYGIGLPDEVLIKIYHANAVKLVPDLKKTLGLYASTVEK